MSRILLVWELGLGYGHTGRLVPLAEALARRGHEPVLALRDPTAVAAIADGGGLRTLPVPLWMNEISGLPPPASMAEVLLRFGFHDPAALAALLRAWRSLVELAAPDLVLFDHAPTALLATRGLPIRRALYGDGFCAPPPIDPLPAACWWQTTPAMRLADSARHVLDNANRALRALDAPVLDTLSGLYETDENFLLTVPELDHYPERPGARYWGPVYTAGRGAVPTWPLSGDRRVFAYLSPRATWFSRMIEALRDCGASVLVFSPGIAPRAARSLSSATLTISDRPYDMTRIRAECDVAVTQSGIGTAAALLLAGKPQLMVPDYTEREMLARRIEAAGAGIVLAPQRAAVDCRRPLKRLLSDAGLAAAAAEIAARYPDHDPVRTVEAVADRCVTLLEEHRP